MKYADDAHFSSQYEFRLKMTRFIKRSEVNMLMAALRRFGITPSEVSFDKDLINQLSVPLPITVKVNRSDFSFIIEDLESDYWIVFFPGSKGPGQVSARISDFETVCSRFSNWAASVAKELKEPDPFSLLGTNNLIEPELLGEQHNNEKISQREFAAIKTALAEIRRYLVEEVKPDTRHLAAIDDRLNFLEQSAKTQDRKGWIFAAIGVAFTIADGLAMSPEQAHKLFAILSDLFRHTLLKLLS